MPYQFHGGRLCREYKWWWGRPIGHGVSTCSRPKCIICSGWTGQTTEVSDPLLVCICFRRRKLSNDSGSWTTVITTHDYLRNATGSHFELEIKKESVMRLKLIITLFINNDTFEKKKKSWRMKGLTAAKAEVENVRNHDDSWWLMPKSQWTRFGCSAAGSAATESTDGNYLHDRASVSNWQALDWR